jgi:hypothetical protein
MRRTAGILVAAAALASAATVYVSAQDAQAEKTIIANERAVQGAVAKGTVEVFKQHVAADAWTIDSMTGRTPVADFVKDFAKMTTEMKITSWDITDMKTIWPDPNTAVLTYKWTGVGTYQGQPVPSPAWCSTVWSKKGGTWMAVFHQESVAMPMPAKK